MSSQPVTPDQQPQQQSAPQPQQDPQAPSMQEVLGGQPQTQAPTVPTPEPQQPSFKPGITKRLLGVVEGLAEGFAHGGAIGAVGNAIAGGVDPRIPARQISYDRDMANAQRQSALNQVKFQSLQAAKMQSDLAVQKIQTENLPTEIQQSNEARGLQTMKMAQEMGLTPTIITADTPEAHSAALAHLTATRDGVPPMASLHVGGQIVQYDLSQMISGGDKFKTFQMINATAPYMAMPELTYADYQKLKPEKQIELANQALTFWQPAADPKDIRGQIENYKSLKNTFMASHPDDKTTAKKYDDVITSLQQSGGHFLNQDIQRTQAMAKAHQDAAIGEAFADTSENSLAAQLVNGTLDPSQLSKRGKDYSTLLRSANEYSLQKFGKSFDAAQAQADYKYATNPSTQNTLKYLNSLTGADNKGGNLGELIKISDSITRSRFPSLNDAAGWARIQAGDPAMAQYHAAITEVADQVAKILQGGGSGAGTSDAKLKQAADLFRQGFTKQQIGGVATTLRDLLTNRKTELIGDNRYLKRQYGVQSQPTNTAPSGNGGATHVYDPTTGTVKPISGNGGAQ